MSRLPELERELVTVAARLGSPRRRLARTARFAAPGVALVVAAIALIAVFTESDDPPAAPRAGTDHRRDLSTPPKPDVEALAGTLSKPLDLTAAGTRYTAVGFRTSQSLICVTLTDARSGTLAGRACLAKRGLRDALHSRPAHTFAAGGASQGLVHTGFARADVTELAPMRPPSRTIVVLSKPWRPWNGEPIRFFLVFTPHAGRPEPGDVPHVSLRAQLSDGRTVTIP